MVDKLLAALGVPSQVYHGGQHVVRSPIDGSQIGAVALDTPEQVTQKIARAQAAFEQWRQVPAPRRG
ncbi:MAG: aldehyde dehydrogenase family protein, partial [Alcaligenaceae bacterium]